MNILKYAAGIPAVAAVVATLYGGLQYVSRLQNTIENNEKTILVMQAAMSAEVLRFDTITNANYRELSNLHKLLETTTAQALNNEVEKITDNLDNSVEMLADRIKNEVEKLKIGITANTTSHIEAREQLVIQVAELHTSINRAVLLGESLRDQLQLTASDAELRGLEGQLQSTASEAELRALEQSYYKLNDSLNQMTFDLKEMTRQINGGY